MSDAKLEVQYSELPKETVDARKLLEESMAALLNTLFENMTEKSHQTIMNTLRGLQVGLAFQLGMAEGMMHVFFEEGSKDREQLNTLLTLERTRYIKMGQLEATMMDRMASTLA